MQAFQPIRGCLQLSENQLLDDPTYYETHSNGLGTYREYSKATNGSGSSSRLGIQMGSKEFPLRTAYETVSHRKKAEAIHAFIADDSIKSLRVISWPHWNLIFILPVFLMLLLGLTLTISPLILVALRAHD